MNSPVNLTSSAPNVIHAGKRFHERRLPVGCAVVHPRHGHGKIEACRGAMRVVSFGVRKALPLDQAMEHGWVTPADVQTEEITHVAMLEVYEAIVSCGDLELDMTAVAAIETQAVPCTVLNFQAYR